MTSSSPTLREVAAAAGVHHTTLSRALRGHPDISEKRTKELCEFAKKMGYVPDPMLRALAAYRTGTRPAAFHSLIAWLNPTPVNSFWRQHRTFRGYFDSAAQRAKQLGFKLEEISVDHSVSGSKKLNTIMNARNIQAAIIVPSPIVPVRLDFVDWRRIAAVRIGFTLAYPNFHTISANHHEAVLMVADELKKRGYQRPGLCLSKNMDERSNMQWFASFLRVQATYEEENRIPNYIFDTYSHDDFCRWIEQHEPDAIVAVGDDLIPSSLEKEGLRIPDDIGLAALVQPEHSDVISGIAGNHRGVGGAAVDFLVAMLNRRESGIPDSHQTLLMDNQWIECGTLRPRLEEG